MIDKTILYYNEIEALRAKTLDSLDKYARREINFVELKAEVDLHINNFFRDKEDKKMSKKESNPPPPKKEKPPAPPGPPKI
jgi:hypothetical protein